MNLFEGDGVKLNRSRGSQVDADVCAQRPVVTRRPARRAVTK